MAKKAQSVLCIFTIASSLPYPICFAVYKTSRTFSSESTPVSKAACRKRSPTGCWIGIYNYNLFRDGVVLLRFYNTAFFDGNFHTVLHICKKLLAQFVDNGHFRVCPDTAEYCAGRRQRVDRH